MCQLWKVRLLAVRRVLYLPAVVTSALIFSAGVGYADLVADFDGDGVDDSRDLDQDNDGLTNGVEGYQLVSDPAAFPADLYQPVAVEAGSGSQSIGSNYRFQLEDTIGDDVHWFQGSVLSATTTLNWSSYKNLPKIQLENPGKATIKWALFSAQETVPEMMNIDFTVSDLDAERSETIIVAQESIIGYSLSSDSAISVMVDQSGWLNFTAIDGDDGHSDGGSVTLHIRDKFELIMVYSSISNAIEVSGLNNDRAGFRHDFSNAGPQKYIAVERTRDTDLDGVPDHRDLDSDNDGVADVLEALGVDVNADDQADGAVSSDGIPLTAGSGLIAPDINENGVADPYDFAGTPAITTPTVVPVEALVPAPPAPPALDNDSDRDGLTDSQERQLGSDPNNPDTDGDGFTDSEEVTIFHTDPLLEPSEPDIATLVQISDADNDGVADTVETMADHDNDGVPNQFDLDSDNDGTADIIESGREDENADGQLDDPEIQPIGSPLDLPDYDQDGFANMFDLDSDQDGLNDIVETNGIDVDENGAVDVFIDANGDGWADQFLGVKFSVIDSDKDGDADYLDDRTSVAITPQSDDVIGLAAVASDSSLQTGVRGSGCALVTTETTASPRDFTLLFLLLIAISRLPYRKRSGVVA